MIKQLKRLIPRSYFPRISFFKNTFFSNPQKSYSQFGEDVILQKLLKKKNGFYVDVGAYHPKHYSNTYLLHKKGWGGINIDPNPETIKLFDLCRRNDTNIQTGISNERKNLTYYTFSHSNWNTFSKEKAEMWRQKSGVNFIGEQKISCVSLREILKHYVPLGTAIDLLNVDAEGMDLEVLESNDWGKYAPRVVVVESTRFNPDVPRENEIYAFLSERSYTLYAFVGMSLIFVKKQYE
ncbi:MAG: FkbM family methyltransferase [Parcubacteria group bacterium]|nr:FkbM family methyltransferase [Parcubacteria group bacterium]